MVHDPDLHIGTLDAKRDESARNSVLIPIELHGPEFETVELLKHEAPFRRAFRHLAGQVQRGHPDLRRRLRLRSLDLDSSVAMETQHWLTRRRIFTSIRITKFLQVQ